MQLTLKDDLSFTSVQVAYRGFSQDRTHIVTFRFDARRCLLINAKQRSPGLFVAGLVLCGLGAVGSIGMTALFPRWLLFSALGSIMLVLVGVLTLMHSLLQRPIPQELPAE